MRAWYLLYSKPLQERIALENLERQGYEAYLPLVAGRRRRRGRPVGVIEPMFPRYLFVYLSDEVDDWGPIRSTKGVAKLVRFGSRAARVPDALVGALREREDERGLQPAPSYELKEGQRVRIAEGVMAGYEAIFLAKSGRERVLLLLEVAGNCARLETDAAQIEPIAAR